MAGAATCEAKGIVIRPEPGVLEPGVLDVEVVIAEPPEEGAANAPTGPSLEERRKAAYRVLREDARSAAANKRGASFDEMLWRVHMLLSAMECEAENGDYDG